MVAYLVNQLRVQGIDVHKRTKRANKGEYVVLLNQPYSGFADALLSKQNYPKKAKHNPYDDIAWTYGLMYGVDVNEVKEVKDFSSDRLELITDDIVNNGNKKGVGNKLVVNYKAQNEVLPILYEVTANDKNITIEIATEDFTIKGNSLAVVSILVSGGNKSTTDKIKRMWLDVIKVSSTPSDASARSLKLPRIAIYHTWYDTQAKGWARYTFENQKSHLYQLIKTI